MHVTSRQLDILGLVAAGLSDKQIAVRLGLSRRTIRTHLEKLFAEYGLRSRAEAVAQWLRSTSAQAQPHPVNECPYPKPFSAEFDECPAFQARQVSDFDLSYGLLGRTLTCRHLVSRRLPNAEHRWYGACVVGDAQARRQWAAAVGSERLKQIGALRQELGTVGARYADALWGLKGEQLKALQSSRDPVPATAAMERLATRLLSVLGTYLQTRRALLDDLHLPLDGCIELVRSALQQFVAEKSGEFAWEIPEEVLARFPEDARLFLRPGSILSRTAEPTTAASAPGAEFQPVLELQLGLA